MSNNKLLGKVILSGGLNQAITAILGLVRVPLVISTFGSSSFASYAAALGFWTLIAAVGESARQRVRILKYAGNLGYAYRKILLQSVFVAVAAGGALGAIFLSIGGEVRPDKETFSVALICGILYIPFAMEVGRLEGDFKFATANLVISIGQLLGFCLTLVACYLGQIWLVGLSVLFPFFLPGILLVLKGLGGRRENESQSISQIRTDPQTGTHPMMLVVLLAETLVYAIDGALVLRFAGPSEAANYAIVQRIAAVFAILPIIVAPLSAALNLKEVVDKLSTKVSRMQTYVGLFLAILVMSVGFPLFQFLSHGKLNLSVWTLLAACGSGFILAATTTEIQSATSSRLIRVKAKMASGLALFNICFAILLCPFIGATAAFLGTGIGQILYFSVVRKVRKRERK